MNDSSITEKLTAEERPHHDFSPSTLQYREACPYYDGLNNESEASKAGTRQHNAVDAGEVDHALSDDEAVAVADCLAFFDSIVAKYPGGTVVKEEYLPIDSDVYDYTDFLGEKRTIQSTTAGYLDACVVSADKKTAEIVDWKFGKWAVEDAENNLQGMAYLLGILVRFPNLESVTVHFVLPHRDEHTFHTFKRAQFPELYRRVRTVVLRTLQARKDRDFTKANPNLGACMFCANAGKCDALINIALRIGNKFSPIQIPETITPSLLKDPKETGQGMRVASVVEAWAKAYKAQAAARAIEEEDFIPDGYELSTSSDREIKDPKKLREVSRRFGLTDEEIDSASKFFITPLEALIRAKAPRGEKTETAEQFTKIALEEGALEMGATKSFLRMSRTKKENTQE